MFCPRDPPTKNSGSLAYRGSVAHLIDSRAKRSPRPSRGGGGGRREKEEDEEQVAVLKKQNLTKGVRKQLYTNPEFAPI